MLTGYIGSKGDNTANAIEETVKIMTTLQEDVPEEKLEQKRLDALNGFVFNVDTPAALAEAVRILADDDALRQRIATGGYEVFRERLTTRMIGDQLASVIENVLCRSAS